MIKKIFTTLLLMLGVIAAGAADWHFQWGNIIDGMTKGGDMPIAVKKAADGNYIALFNWGSRVDQGDSLYYGANVLKGADGKNIKGQYYKGNACNRNLGLMKINALTGAPIWTVYSSIGDWEHGYTGFTQLSDGSIIIVGDVRNYPEGATSTTLFSIVGSDGVVKSVTYTPDPDRPNGIFKGGMVKVNPDGTVAWAKMFMDTKNYTLDTNKKASNPAFIKGIDVDASDHLYVWGTNHTNLILQDANGGTKTITAQNLEGYDGSVQTVTGDLYLLKLDAEGRYLDDLTATGVVTMSSFDKAQIVGDKIFLVGRMADKSGRTISLGGFTIGTSNEFQNTIVTSVDLQDFHVNYARVIPFVPGDRKTLQHKNMQHIGGHLYVTGAIRGGFSSDGVTTAITNGSNRAFVLKLKADDGTLQAGSVRTEGNISAYFGVVPTTAGFSVVGYDMGKGLETTAYSDDLTEGVRTTMIQAEGVLSEQAAPLIDGKSVVFMPRSRDQVTYIVNTDQTMKASGKQWNIILSKFSYEDIKKDINLAISPYGYSTYYNGTEAYVMPVGVEGAVVTGLNNDNSLALDWRYAAGSTVPAGTALVLRGQEGSYQAAVTESTEQAPSDNKLKGSDEAEETTGGNVYLQLNYTSENGVGFYFGAKNGVAFINQPHHAYLAFNVDLPSKFAFYSIDGTSTGIGHIRADRNVDRPIYTLSGMRVKDATTLNPGIYIINGKKVIVK